MGKKSDRLRAQSLFESVLHESTVREPDDEDDSSSHTAHPPEALSNALLTTSRDFATFATVPGGRRPLTLLKKFRFQLLTEWITTHTSPCRVADIGGGKGLISYLLGPAGYEATVIDPISQALPTKYKDLVTNRQVRIAATETVARRDERFSSEMAADFDLLLGMHAHGCNIQIIDAAKRYRRDFLLLPCCIIDEPLRPTPGTHWLQCVADYARAEGFTLEPFRLNFKGQNIGLYARSRR